MLDVVKAKVIECIINSEFKIEPVKAKKGYKVNLKLGTDFSVDDCVIEVVQFIKTGTQLMSPTLKQIAEDKEGVAFVENTDKAITFYTNSSSKEEAIKDVANCIKQDYEETSNTFKETKLKKYAQEVNKLIKLYNSLKNVTETKGVV